MTLTLINIVVKITYLPRVFFDFVISLFINHKNDWSLLAKYFKQDILIVGNGPSLKKTPLDKIDMVSIGMNKINLLFDKTEWRPNLITCVNGFVIKQNKEFFNTTKIPIILPIRAFYLGIKKRPNIFFVNLNRNSKFSNNIKNGVGIGATVTYTALQIAAFLQAKSVSIVGVDHSFTSMGKAHSVKVLNKDDENHFDPDYFKNQYWGLPDLEGSEKAYLLAKNYFDKKAIPITDYTIDGKLNIFNKAKIELIIK